jgi:hypothetical protein
MSLVCGSFQIGVMNRFRSYDDLEVFVSKSGVDGMIVGEDASVYAEFCGMEIRQTFEGICHRVGVISENSMLEPQLFPIHGAESLAIGMNRTIVVIDIRNRVISHSIDLDSMFLGFIANDEVLVAVHDLGARILRIPSLNELADAFCETVVDVSLTKNELILVSDSDETTRVAITL